MSETFFISDTHFGHKGIINFSSTKPFRPFKTIEEHDAELVRRWNSVVGKKDRVFHLGDFCFGKRNLEVAAQLNGDKRLVMGNHDTYATEDYLKYFNKLYGACQFDNCILTHVPVHPRELGRFPMNVHGHLHTEVVKAYSQPLLPHSELEVEGVKPDWRYFNVSCEQINLTPIPYDIIMNRWAENN